ncbi:GPI mannosyltransferase 3-like isoform X2 [Anneissia japonica]|uniref:GPI mannosyltransferase 3-like isoform X2 n=1 Tax=Anneissia japonica TaxID=1529436 RepID=UPI0014255A7B|nr:GPI mannosyltransferase 3-like isoform X2 [Anneissia japonica]
MLRMSKRTSIHAKNDGMQIKSEGLLHRDDSLEDQSEMPANATLLWDVSNRLQRLGWKRILLMLVVFRCINALLVQTWFVPDEYWQAVEVAHKMVFKYGYLTWEWDAGIRGYLHPLLFAILFKILQLLHLDFPLLLIHSPHILQGVFSAVGDLHIYLFARNLTSPSIALLILISHLSNWFVLFTATRTLANTMEMILTSVALSCYPTTSACQQQHRAVYLVIVGLACIIRPTAGIVWLPLVLWHLAVESHKLKFIFTYLAPICFCSLLLSLAVDRLFYGKWIIVQLNFLKFNLLHDMADFYGAHPWHWYITQGFPVLLGPQLVLFVISVVYHGKQLKHWLCLIFWTITVYSILGHKEFRFLMSLLPIAALFNGLAMLKMLRTKLSTALLSLLLTTSIIMALYTGLVHQRGAIHVMEYLRWVAASGGTASVMFLMPCHSTPYYSYIHTNITMRFLECPPDLHRKAEYVDVADVFYRNPKEWLDKEFNLTNKPPTHLVMYDRLANSIEEFLQFWEFKKCHDVFHSHFPDGRVGTHVLVFCRNEVVS